jgi:hypothetical protein
LTNDAFHPADREARYFVSGVWKSIVDRKRIIDHLSNNQKSLPRQAGSRERKTKDRTESNENSSNDIQALCIMGAQPERKKNDRKKPHCEATEQVPRVSS